MNSLTHSLATTIRQLIEVESTERNRSALQQVIDRVGEFFSETPVYLHPFHFNGYPSLVITTRPTRCPRILLHGHLDVVPGHREQFRPRIVGDRLLGRGAVDMKGFVGVAMHVLRDLASGDHPPDIGLMVNTDEEIGGRNGAAAMVADGWRAGQLLNGDGGYGDAVTFAQKGIVQLTLQVTTEPGLRNAPWDGIGAAELLTRELASGLARLCPDQDRLTAEANWGSTATVLSLHSESDDNLPPRRATASVRVYWAGDASGDAVIARAREAFPRLEVSGTVEGERVFLSPENPRLLRLRRLWQQNLGRPIGIRADNGSSDAKWFAPLGIPILILRVPGGGAHCDEEWLEVSSLEPLYRTLVQYITDEGQEIDQSAAADDHQTPLHATFDDG